MGSIATDEKAPIFAIGAHQPGRVLRQRAKLSVPFDLLAALLHLPSGEILAAQPNHKGGVDFMVESEDFTNVLLGDPMPEVRIIFTTNRDRHIVESRWG